MAKLTIIGTGHLASAIAKLHRDHYVERAFDLCIMTHSANKAGQLLYGTLIQAFDTNILQTSDLVLLAIPAERVIAWAIEHQEFLNNQILIDCSNKVGNGKKLQAILDDKGCSVVKSFTAINVFHITDAKFSVTESSKEMLLAGNDERALSVVSALVKNLGFTPKQIPSIEVSEIMEAANFSSFSKWQSPLIVSTITWLFYEVYAVLERNILQDKLWYNQGIQNMNAAFACNALTLLGLVYGAGAIAQIKQDLLGRALTATADKYLVGCLDRRKQLGLTAMFNLSAHVTISLLLFGSTYYEYFSVESNNSTSLTNAATISLICGVLGYLGYSLIGLTSLPSIAAELGMTEWRTVQSYLGWSALILGTGHVMAMGYQYLLDDTKSGHTIPSLFLLSALIPCFAVASKIISLFTNCCGMNKSSYRSSVEIEVIEDDLSASVTYDPAVRRNMVNFESYNRHGTFGRSGRNTQEGLTKSLLESPNSMLSGEKNSRHVLSSV